MTIVTNHRLGFVVVAALAAGLAPVAAIAAPPSTDDPGTSTPASGLWLDGGLEPGTHTFDLREEGKAWMSMTVTLPNEEWAGRMGWVLGTDGFLNSRTGLSIQFWSAPDVVYGHPCQWAGTEIDVEPTVDSVVDALADQGLRDATTPREITVGDHRGVELELTVPDDIDFATCDDATFWSWVYGPSDGRFQQGPAQHDLIRIVDVDGVLVLVDATYWPELPADTHVEMLDVLASMAFEPTDVADKPS